MTSPNANPDNPIVLVGQVHHPKADDERINPALAAMYLHLGIATAAVDTNPAVIKATDPVWRIDRRIGTQTTDTTSHGVPSGTGATITEAGFVNSASCMTSHSRASMDSNGDPGVGASVGAYWRLDLFGFGQLEMGAPKLDWFFYPGTSTPYSLMQFELIWGTLNACCVTPAATGNVRANIPPAPTLL